MSGKWLQFVVTGMYMWHKHRLLYEHNVMVCRTEIHAMGKYRLTQKNGNFWKTQQKLKKSKKKNLFTEIEPLQLAF